MKNNSDNP